jgi:CheY-like chemotaxis protein
MPRLLLVDDNPSIHRIAESLLAPTAIELVCVDSAAEALDRIQSGERFDVAMVDTAMPGMDGWTLVERLRSLEATARMPIALMAGVLDPVDPQKLERAPIQGFLKKPIELRELADRVNTLMATPVGAPIAPVEPLATQPLSREEAAAAIAAFPDFTPTLQLPDEGEEDLLLLTAEDLWPEEAAAAEPLPAVSSLPQADLELEELDLEGLQSLAAPAQAPAFELPSEPAVMPLGEPTRETPALPELETLGADELAGLLETDLGEPEIPIVPIPSIPVASPAVEAPAAGAFALPEPEPELEMEELELPPSPPAAPVVAAPLAVAPMAEPVAPLAPIVPAVPVASAASAPVSSEALVQAILADPQAMAQLKQALVTQLGEEQLKALAWEVLPDLAKKLS